MFNQEAFEVYCDYHGIAADPDEYTEEFEDSFAGEQTLEDYVEELLDEGAFGNIAENIRRYIDVEAIARDMRIEGYWEEDGYLFRPV